MRNSILHILFILLSTLSVHAQPGIRIGYTNSSHILKTADGKEKMNADGMTAGVTYDFKLHKNTGLRTGLMYGFQWYSDSYSQDIGINLNEHLVEHNLHLPVYIRQEIEMIPEILSLTLSAGPAFSYGLASRTDIFMFGAMDAEVRYDNYSGNLNYIYFPYDDSLKEVIDGSLRDAAMLQNRFDISFGGSIGLKIIRQIELEIGYDFGLTNRYKDAKDITYHRNSFRFTLCYLF